MIRRVIVGIVLLLLVFLGGCAGQQAWRDGNARFARGDWQGGLQKLQTAMEAEPTRVDYRQAYFTRREGIVNRLLGDAEHTMREQRFNVAEALYQQVLAIDPENHRAQEGELRLRNAQRHEALLNQADDLLRAQRLDEVPGLIQLVLSESPGHRRAEQLAQEHARLTLGSTDGDMSLSPSLKAAYRKPVSINLVNASLSQIFEVIKAAAGINFIFDRDVRSDARSTWHISNKPIEDVIRLVLASHQLAKRVLDEDTLLLYPNTPQKNADYREMVIRSFYIAHADIRQVAAMLRSMVKPKEVYVDEKLNILMVRDSIEIIRLAERLVANQDMPDAEVMLELEVLEVSNRRLMDLGIQWPSSVSASVSGAAGRAGQLGLDEFRRGGSGLVSLQFSDPLVAAKLLAQRSDTELLANPRIRVRNKEPARILIGQRVPVITTATTANVGVSESVSYLDVGLKLEIVPTIALNDEVSMRVSLEVSSILNTVRLASGGLAYTLGTRNASTVLRVMGNETQILAGLIQRDNQQANTGVPGLNKLPILNRLFGQASDSSTQTEVVLLITPRVVRNIQVPNLNRMRIPAGTDAGLGAPPISLGAPAARSLHGSADAMPVPDRAVPMQGPVESVEGRPVVPMHSEPHAPSSSRVRPGFVPPPVVPSFDPIEQPHGR